MEAQLDRAHRERRSLAESVGRMQPGATVEQTADGVCVAVRSAIGADLVAVMLFEPDGTLRTLASSAAEGQASLISDEISPARAAHLIERTRVGPWIELPGENVALGEYWSDGCTAYAPILTDDGGAVGLLLAASTAPGYRERVTGWLPLVSDFAGVASALLTPELRAGRVAADERDRLESIIAEHRFVSVFQPIVEMESRSVTGYEALTRFGDERAQCRLRPGGRDRARRRARARVPAVVPRSRCRPACDELAEPQRISRARHQPLEPPRPRRAQRARPHLRDHRADADHRLRGNAHGHREPGPIGAARDRRRRRRVREPAAHHRAASDAS